jgi:hypothetical protein
MIDVMPEGEHGRQAMLNRLLCNVCSMLGESKARLHHHQLRSAFRRGFACVSEVVSWVYLERLHQQIERLCALVGRSELVGSLCVVEHGHPVAVRKHLANDYAR